jgi:hypothetical protein
MCENGVIFERTIDANIPAQLSMRGRSIDKLKASGHYSQDVYSRDLGICMDRVIISQSIWTIRASPRALENNSFPSLSCSLANSRATETLSPSL